MGLTYVLLTSEDEYIKEFKKIYNQEIITPDGFCIKFDLSNDSAITHFWRGGKQGKFNRERAARIHWIKGILQDADSRVVKYNPQNNNIYFISNRIGKNTFFAIRCIFIKNKNKYRCLTAFLIQSKERDKYLKSFLSYPLP